MDRTAVRPTVPPRGHQRFFRSTHQDLAAQLHAMLRSPPPSSRKAARVRPLGFDRLVLAALLFSKGSAFGPGPDRGCDHVPFPNIQYVGQGYNIVRGNPRPSQASVTKGVFDPGWCVLVRVRVVVARSLHCIGIVLAKPKTCRRPLQSASLSGMRNNTGVVLPRRRALTHDAHTRSSRHCCATT